MTAMLLAAWLLAVGLSAAGLRAADHPAATRPWALAVLAAGPVGLVWFRRARGARRRAVRPYVGGCLGLLAGTATWWVLPLGFAGAAVAYAGTVAGGFLAALAARGSAHRAIGHLTRHGGPGLTSMAGVTVTLHVVWGTPDPAAAGAWLAVVGGLVAGAVLVPTTAHIAGRLPLARTGVSL